MKYTNALGGCANCGALTSPCWRKGPEDAKHLCNACGSRYLVKGTLEGYKPGQKNRTGSKRGRASKSSGFSSKFSDAHQRSDYSLKRSRLYKEQRGECTYVEKAVQVDPVELQSMQPFPQLFTAAGGSGTYLADSNSPTSHFERIAEDLSEGSQPGKKASPEAKGSSEDSSLDQGLTNLGMEQIMRRRARKPFKPTSSTW